MDDKRRHGPGRHYHPPAGLRRQTSWGALLATEQPPAERMFAFTTRGSHNAFEARFQPGDWLVFGAETQGLPEAVREQFPLAQRLRLPMRTGQRSLNLSNAVAVAGFEAWRQNGFNGST